MTDFRYFQNNFRAKDAKFTRCLWNNMGQRRQEPPITWKGCIIALIEWLEKNMQTFGSAMLR